MIEKYLRISNEKLDLLPYQSHSGSAFSIADAAESLHLPVAQYLPLMKKFLVMAQLTL